MLDVAVRDGQPIVAGTALPVAAVVHACHEKTIDVGLAELAVPGLDRATLEPILTYCAEQRCKADGATCPGAGSGPRSSASRPSTTSSPTTPRSPSRGPRWSCAGTAPRT